MQELDAFRAGLWLAEIITQRFAFVRISMRRPGVASTSSRLQTLPLSKPAADSTSHQVRVSRATKNTKDGLMLAKHTFTKKRPNLRPISGNSSTALSRTPSVEMLPIILLVLKLNPPKTVMLFCRVKSSEIYLDNLTL